MIGTLEMEHNYLISVWMVLTQSQANSLGPAKLCDDIEHTVLYLYLYRDHGYGGE